MSTHDQSHRPPQTFQHHLNWPLVLGLTAVGLIRPLFSILGLNDILGKPATPLILTGVISLAWILAVSLTRVREPLLTLVVTGMAYAVATIVISAILSPLLTGELQGPLGNPVSIVPLLMINVVWGTLCGLAAVGVRRMRGLTS